MDGTGFTHHEGSRISDASSLSALIGPASTHMGASSTYESRWWLCVMLHFLDTFNMMRAIHARAALAHTALCVAGVSPVDVWIARMERTLLPRAQ